MFRSLLPLTLIALLYCPLLLAGELQVPSELQKPSKPQVNPDDSSAWWLGIVLSNDLPIYISANSEETLHLEKPAVMGDTVFILAKNETPARYLISRFDARSLEFKQHVGWVDQAWIKSDAKPYTVGEAQKYLQACWPGDNKKRAMLDRMLGVGTAADASQNTPLKAVTHPTLGHFASFRPVPSAKFQEWSSQAEPGEGRSIQRFSFYYVIKIIVTGPEDAFAVLSIDSNLDWFDPHAIENSGSKLVGIVPLDHLALVPSRTGLVPNNTEAAFSSRVTKATPLKFYRNFQQAKAAVRGQVDDIAGDKVEPVWEETFTAEPIPAPDGSYGYLIVDSHQVRDAEGREVPVYHLAVPARLHDDSPAGIQNLVDRQLEADRKKLLDATLTTRTCELVFVIDATGSMQPVYTALLEAVNRYVAKLSSTEASRPDLDQIRLKVAVVLYRDLSDGPRLTESSDGYFDLTSQVGLDAFADFMNNKSRLCGGGGDTLEQPFEGLKLAIEKFCASGSPYHTPGAATMITVMGDHGNHPKGALAAMDVGDVIKIATASDAQGEFAPIIINPVYTQFESVTDAEWDSQMGALAEKTRGIVATMQFKQGALTAEMPLRLASHLERLIEDRREQSRKGRADYVSSVTGSNNLPPTLSLSGRILRKQLEEIIPASELEKIATRLGQTVFAYLFVVGDPTDMPVQHPRFLPRVLLTKQEILRLTFVCNSMATSLNEQLGKIDAESKGGQAYNELLIRVLVSVMGDREPTEKDLAKWRGAAPSDIERELSRLPVRFDCLRDPVGTVLPVEPNDESHISTPLTNRTFSRHDIIQLTQSLQRAKASLESVLLKRQPVTPGIGYGELHYAVQPSELP